MSAILSFDEKRYPSYNYFDNNSTDNSKHIKALLLVQKDIITTVLSPREKLIVNMCVCKRVSQAQVASLIGVKPSTVCRQRENAIAKMRKYINICDKALRYYESIEVKS